MVDEPKPEGDPNRGSSRSGPQHPLHPHRPPFSRRQLAMQVVVAAVILASGIGIGTGGTILALKDRIVWQPPPPPPDRGEQRPRPDFVGELKAKYNLTDEQVQKVKDLFAKRWDDGRKRWEELRKIELEGREQFAIDMKGILTPEQFEPWHAEYQARMAEADKRPMWGPRGDHRGPRGDRGPGSRRGPDSRRGDWPPRPPMGPNDHHKGDHPPDVPIEINSRPGEVNAPK